MRKLVALLIVMAPHAAVAEKNLEKSGAWDCKKDPVVLIANGSGKYTFKGACKKISVAGGDNTLAIASVETLDVPGGGNKITVTTVNAVECGGAENTIKAGTVGSIDVGGSDNTITWKKAKTGAAPKITGQPDMNKVSQAK